MRGFVGRLRRWRAKRRVEEDERVRSSFLSQFGGAYRSSGSYNEMGPPPASWTRGWAKKPEAREDEGPTEA